MADSQGKTLPFGLRLDKWRVPKRHQIQAPISCGSAVFKTSDAARVCRQRCEPPTQGSGAGCGTPVHQDRTDVEVATQVLVRRAEVGLPVDCREVETADAQALAPCPARRHSSVLASLTAAHKLKGAAEKLRGRLRSPRIPMDPSAKRANAVRVRTDREFCLDKMLACMQQPGHLFSQGFQEVDARTLAIFCQPVKVSKDDAFVEAGELCEHLVMVLEGKIVAYHRSTVMKTYEAGSLAGTQGLTADNAKFMFTLIAEEDSEEQMMNFCFETLFSENLDLEHKRHVFDAASLAQNAYRAHLARRELSRVRDILEGPSATVISKKMNFDAGVVARTRSLDSENPEPIVLEGDRYKALKRWKLASLTRCFTRWKTLILILHDKAESGLQVVKNMIHGETFSCFHKWAQLIASYGDLVTTWRSCPGLLVALSKEGREHSILHSDQVDGDTECGVMIEPVLSDRTVWQVRWSSTGKKGVYYVGSMGRYHLRLWNRESRRSEGVVEVPGSHVSLGPDDHHGFLAIKRAFMNDKGMALSLNVTAPYGGKMQMPCPRKSPWNITLTFPTRAVLSSQMIQIQGLEASSFDSTKIPQGNVMSPVVSVRQRNDVQLLKPYTLVIPHRAAAFAIKHLALYHWPENKSVPDRVLNGVTIDDEYCTVEIQVFGIFAVIATKPSVPEVVYARLSFPTERRDITGKQINTVWMSTSFKGAVHVYPKAFLEPPVDLPVLTSTNWMTMPRFPLVPGVIMDSVQLSLATSTDGCKLSSWSGRGKWKGRPLRFDFEGIMQPVQGQTLKNPVVLCQCLLIENATGNAPIKFAGPHCFRLQIERPTLRVVLHTPNGEPETYLRMLQAQETLLDIRKWLAKAWLIEKCSLEKLRWLCTLRFFHEHESISLQVEALERAGRVLPAIELRPVCPTDESHGTSEQIKDLEAMLREVLHVPYAGPVIVSRPPVPHTVGNHTAFVGGGAVFAGKKGHHNYAKSSGAGGHAKGFACSDALLFNSAYFAGPATRQNHSSPMFGQTQQQSVTMSLSQTPESPVAKWSPKVDRNHAHALFVDRNIAELDAQLLQGDGRETKLLGRENAARRVRKRPKTSSSLMRTLSALAKTRGEYISFRPGDRPVSKTESLPKTVASELYQDYDTVVPRRPASARFHSPRTQRILHHRAQCMAHRMEEALCRQQVVHVPGQTMQQRDHVLQSILNSPDIVPNLDLDIDGTIFYQAPETANVPTPPRWRAAGRPPARALIPNYLTYNPLTPQGELEALGGGGTILAPSMHQRQAQGKGQH